MLKKAPLAALAAFLTAGALAGPAQARIDFDRDGKSDLLWHNGETGEVRIWRMNGATRLEDLGTTYMGGALVIPNSSQWRAVGVNDFDRDGVPDILWHNGASGEVYIWYMGGTKGTNVDRGASVVGVGVAPVLDSSGWRIVGTGDFNADARPDILWVNRDGQLVTWLMGGSQGNQSLNGLVLNGLSMPESTLTRAVGVVDFNGDNVADILWHNPSTGRLSIWFLNAGATNASTPPTLDGALDLPLSLGNVDSTFYRFVGTEDMDGNGVPDLMWHHQITGDTKYTKLTPGLTALGTDSLSASLNIPDLSGWRIINGTQQPRAWRRGAGCVPYDVIMTPNIVTSGIGVQMTGAGTKVVCPIPKTTSGLGITNDNLVSVDLQISVPTSQVRCTLNTLRTTNQGTSIRNMFVAPKIEGTLGVGLVTVHIAATANTGWWRANDWDYAQMTCELINGNGPVLLNQYWITEDGLPEKGRIYPMSVCEPDGAVTSFWRFYDTTLTGQAGGFIESITNGNNGANPAGGMFQWNCGRTRLSPCDWTLNDTNKVMTLNYMGNLNNHWWINGPTGGFLMLKASAQSGAYTTFNPLSTVSDVFNANSSGLGDTVLLSYRTF